ncbi:hypothetical protein OIU84_024565 [Salix udensis]|uniref:Diphthine--ammonia ligase n=1 Tax=Salix udensis TaxID=889485 RepID=A0AAD6KHJ2_9ROSI|nr:hypothetical protein OIU84_024565 [Salix udensis]
MKVVALVSGGKDSCYAMMKCIQYGHEIVALENLMPADDSVDELDSFMYQTVGHQIIASYAECMGLPLFRRRIQGSTRHQTLNYKTTPGDEVEDMFVLLNEVKRQIPSITAVSSGAIASDYQRLRVESVCSRFVQKFSRFLDRFLLAGSHEDLAIALKHIESQLTGYGFGWGHVLYIHLYIADMNEFAMVNETYVRFITQEKCPFGVPSRSTIELPLLQASLGKAYIEVLVANAFIGRFT